MSSPGEVGAGYIAAMIGGDNDLINSYELAFDPRELLSAIRTQLLVLGRQLSHDTGLTPHELGDRLIAAAVLLARLDAAHNHQEN